MKHHQQSGALCAPGLRRSARLLALLLLMLPQPSWSATIPVTGSCTLADAIDAANSDSDAAGLCPPGGSGADTLTLGGNVTLTVVSTTDAQFLEPTGLPEIMSDITVDGGGFVVERDAGAPGFRIFLVGQGGTLTLDDVTVRGGAGVNYGAGILALLDSTLTLTNATVTSNITLTDSYHAQGGGIMSYAALAVSDSTVSGNYSAFGGGVASLGSLEMSDSTVSANSARVGGGAVHGDGSEMTVSSSTLSGNYAGAFGGAIHAARGSVRVTNSTLSGNVAYVQGGGIWADRSNDNYVTNSTLSGNSAPSAGGVYQNRGVLTLANSIVANSPLGENCLGAIANDGNNLSDDVTCSGAAAIVPGLDFDTTLADNGGPTETHALLSASAARDAAGVCGLAVDQRGVPRDDGACDSGSFELGAEGACCTDGPGTESDCIITNQEDCEANDGLFLGPGMECTTDVDCMVLLVTMDSMSAVSTTDGVRVRWTTALEIDTAGFQVLRESADVREKGLIPVGPRVLAMGHQLSGASYELVDDSRGSRKAKRYYIDDIDRFGKVTRHGPIAVERTRLGADRTTRRDRDGD